MFFLFETSSFRVYTLRSGFEIFYRHFSGRQIENELRSPCLSACISYGLFVL